MNFTVSDKNNNTGFLFIQATREEETKLIKSIVDAMRSSINLEPVDPKVELELTKKCARLIFEDVSQNIPTSNFHFKVGGIPYPTPDEVIKSIAENYIIKPR